MNYFAFLSERVILLLVGFMFFLELQAQEKQEKEHYTPYELMSSYYSDGFQPFKKKNIYIGLAFSLDDKKMINQDYLIQKVLDGERLNYDILIKGGYYTGNYGMIGLNFNYYQQKFEGKIFREPDTLQSKSITRGFELTPNVRSSVPLIPNERFSFFTEVGLTFGRGNTLTRTIKRLDEVEKVYTTSYNFRIGISPGVTFFAMENFAFEVQLNVLGYELDWRETIVNDADKSKDFRQNVSFDINLFSLQMGLSYYIGGKAK